MSKRNQLDTARHYLAFGDTTAGKAIYEDLCHFGHLMEPTMTAVNNPYETAFREGQRSVVLYIMSQMKWGAMDITKLALSTGEDT